MQVNYTAQNLLSELTAQGITIEPTSSGTLFYEGEMSDFQLNALKELKPQILNLINRKKGYRFGPNEHLFFDSESAFHIFDVSNKAANLFFHSLLKFGESCKEIGEEMICFCQPSVAAYKSELRLCAALESPTGGSLQSVSDDFIETHKYNRPLGSWVQDLPLWQVEIFDGNRVIEMMICNAIQTAIFCGYELSKNPDVSTKVKPA